MNEVEKKQNMTTREMVDKLAQSYDTALYSITIDGGKGPVNINVLEAFRWCERNVRPENNRNFYAAVRTTFKPSMTCPFPTPAHLEDAKRIINIPTTAEYKPIDFNETQRLFAEREGIKMDVPEVEGNIELDNLTMTANQLLKKYGIKRCGECWTKQGAQIQLEREKKNPEYFQL